MPKADAFPPVQPCTAANPLAGRPVELIRFWHLIGKRVIEYGMRQEHQTTLASQDKGMCSE